MTNSPTLDVWLEGIGLVGPGFDGWSHAQALLTGAEAYTPRATTVPAAVLLPAAERRRAGVAVRISLAIALEAAQHAQRDAGTLATVFTASGADGDNCHTICEALASEERLISPTRFHNSVHNAPAGYWTIAARCMAPSTSLCAYDASFCAGLLEATTQVRATQAPVLLVAYDTAYPQPLRAARPIPDAFGVAFVLAPTRGERAFARLSVTLDGQAPNGCVNPLFEALRHAIPAARSLPLLEAIARREATERVLDYLPGLSLRVGLRPC
ncbi:MAG TPA: beta-ketoacyl synthase chain length factor [Burkholderiaceae bacterium]|nr:beta-ketoacyl synthase chain length factor [Burkholderiaceae bacterium]